MKRKVHAVAAVLALSFIAAFWISTIIAELFLSETAVAQVKQGIVYALPGFVPVMIAVGGSGFAMGGGGTHPLIVAKRRRMPFIGAIGLLILVPTAIVLSARARAGLFDGVFYGIQALELAAGAVNLVLAGLNFRDGLRLSRRKHSPA